MAVTCPNCGAQNAEGNAFCENCGQPLAAAAPPPAASIPPAPDTAPTTVSPLPGAGAVPPVAQQPPVGPPPVGVPPAAPPPYGAPPPGAAPPPYGGYGAVPPGGAPPYPPYGGGMQPPGPPAHRLPVFAIVGAVVGAIVLLALAAVVVHALAKTSDTTPTPIINPSTPTPLASPTTAPVTTTPTAVASGTAAGTGTPTAVAGTGTPLPQPTVSATTSPNGVTVETNTWKATLPSSDWKVTNQKNASAEIDDPNGNGFIYINAGTQSPAQSTSQIIQSLIAQISQQNQGVKECDNGQQQANVGTPPVTGTTFALCYAVNNQNGQATQVVDAFWIGTTNGGGNIYSLEVFGPNSTFNQLGNDVTPIIKSIQWKV